MNSEPCLIALTFRKGEGGNAKQNRGREENEMETSVLLFSMSEVLNHWWIKPCTLENSKARRKVKYGAWMQHVIWHCTPNSSNKTWETRKFKYCQVRFVLDYNSQSWIWHHRCEECVGAPTTCKNTNCDRILLPKPCPFTYLCSHMLPTRYTIPSQLCLTRQPNPKRGHGENRG